MTLAHPPKDSVVDIAPDSLLASPLMLSREGNPSRTDGYVISLLVLRYNKSEKSVMESLQQIVQI